MIVVMTLLVRDEADIVAATIEHHLAAGVDLIIATDNGSVDGTAEILSAYAAAGALELHHEPAHNFRQSEWVTRMARRAASKFGADWVINSDADEFLWPPGGLKAVLASAGSASVLVPRDNLVADPAAAGLWPSRLILRDPRSLSPRGNRIGPKLIHVADPQVIVAPGNHAANGPRITGCTEQHPLRILHTPERGLEQYRRKIQNGATACRANADLGPEIRWHWREEFEGIQSGTFVETFHARQRTRLEADHLVVSGHLIRDTRLQDRLHELEGSAILPRQLGKVLRGQPDVDRNGVVAA